jgi:NADH-quinone oxidoreductase subunit N
MEILSQEEAQHPAYCLSDGFTKDPWLSFLLLMAFFSIAGIPPLVGFMTKLIVIESLIHGLLILFLGIFPGVMMGYLGLF